MNLFSITCETCQAQLNVTSKNAIGQILSCPKCQSMVHVVAPSVDSDSGQGAGRIEKLPPAPETPALRKAAAPPADELPVSGELVSKGEPRLPAERVASLPEPSPMSTAPPHPAASSEEVRGRRVAALLAIGGLSGLVIVSALAIGLRPGAEDDGVPAADSAASGKRVSVTIPDARDSAAPSTGSSVGSAAPALPVRAAIGLDERPENLSQNQKTPTPNPSSAAADLRPEDGGAGFEVGIQSAPVLPSPEPVRMVDQPDESIDNGSREDDRAAALAIPGNLAGPISAAAPFVRLASPEASTALPDISKRLAMRIPRMKFPNVPLVSFLDDISDIACVPIRVDPASLAGAGVSLFAPVSATVDDVTATELLTSVLGDLGLRHTTCASHVSIGIGDSGLERIEFAADDLCRGFKPAEQAREIVEMIEQLVAPSTWKTAGGRGMMGVRDTTLRITQIPSVHYQVHQFLNQLRIARGRPIRRERPSGRPVVRGPGPLTKEALSKSVSITFSDWTTIERARKEWQRISNLTLLVDWQSLDDRGLSPLSRIRCSVIDQPFGEALSSTLNPLGLTWVALEEGVVQIISQEQALATRETAIYDLSDSVSTDGQSFTSNAAVTDALTRRVAAALGAPVADATILRVDRPSGRLIVSAPQAVHRRMAVWLRLAMLPSLSE